jgi:hypothetical protein
MISKSEKLVMQKVFDKAVSKVVKQGAKSENTYGDCRYRGPDDMKCAVGHLISDKMISDYCVLEDSSVDEFSYKLLNKILPKVDTETSFLFLKDLQMAHDCCENLDGPRFVKEFVVEANKVAKSYGLKKFEIEGKKK